MPNRDTMTQINKFIVLLFTIVFLSGSIYAQGPRLIGERSIYSHHFLNPVLVNPGASGFEDHQELLINYRNSWATFPGSPRTVTFSYNGPIGNRIGVGALLMTDKFAALQTTKGQVSVAYGIESPSNKVSFGLSAEYIQHRLSGAEFDKDLVDVTDIAITQRLDGSQFFDVSFGIYGTYDKKIIYGLTVPTLVSSRLSSGSDATQGREFGFIANLGYRMPIDGYDVTIEPSVFVKQLMLVPFHADLNLKMQFLEERLTGGVSYTLGADEKFGFLVGTKLQTFEFLYSYNISMHGFQNYNNGSHEFSLKFNISPVKTEVIEVTQ